MKSAIETIARVQTVLRFVEVAEVMAWSPGSWLCDWSLTERAIKERSAAVDLRRAEQHLRPVRVDLVGVHRGEHVQQHPVGEEVAHLLGLGRGLALDEFDEPREARPHLLADRGIVAGA